MKKFKRTSISAVGTLVCVAVLGHVDHPDEIAVCLAVVIILAVLHNLLRMCDRLLDPPPAIFRLICATPRFISEMPPQPLTSTAGPIKHRPHSLAQASNGRKQEMIKPHDYQEALGQAIRERRENLEMSREKLGRIAGKDADYIASIESGDVQLDLHQMLVVARVLGIRLSVLFAIVEFRLFED